MNFNTRDSERINIFSRINHHFFSFTPDDHHHAGLHPVQRRAARPQGADLLRGTDHAVQRRSGAHLPDLHQRVPHQGHPAGADRTLPAHERLQRGAHPQLLCHRRAEVAL